MDALSASKVPQKGAEIIALPRLSAVANERNRGSLQR
jgi:hypothetical protein